MSVDLPFGLNVFPSKSNKRRATVISDGRVVYHISIEISEIHFHHITDFQELEVHNFLMFIIM